VQAAAILALDWEVGAAISLVVTGQVLPAMTFDHFGLM